GPLIRVRLLRLRKDEHWLVQTMHHIVRDGGSMVVFAQELSALYAAYTAGKPSPLPELPVQYADYAVWQREQLQGELLKERLAYWKQTLADLPVLVLRADLSGEPSFSEYLARVRRQAREAYAHQDVPFAKLVEELAPKRDPSRNPLFQVSFVKGTEPSERPELRGLTVDTVETKG